MGSPPRSSPASPASLRSQLNRYRHCASLDPQRRFRWRKEDSCMRKDDSGCATTIPEAQGRFRMRNDVSGRARTIPACATTIPVAQGRFRMLNDDSRVAQGRFRHAQRRFRSRKEDSGCATTILVALVTPPSPASSASLARRLFCENAKWVEFRGQRSAKS